jgi:hypothetical protein
MALPEELRAGLQNLLASGSFEIRESCSRVPPVPPVSWEVPGGAGKASRPLLGGELQPEAPRHSGTQGNRKPDLPRQAADYWARIRRHQAQGHLARYGYFSGMQLQASPPIVFGLDSSCLPHESQ